MTLAQAIEEFGMSVSEIAVALDISVQAVYKWRNEVPRLRVYELREIKAPKQPVQEAA